MKTFILAAALMGSFTCKAQDYQNDDTTRMKMGKLEIILVENSNGDTTTYIIRDGDTTWVNGEKDAKKSYFDKASLQHYSGFQLFSNGYLTANNSADVRDVAGYMDLDYARSLGYAFNFGTFIPFTKAGLVGLTTGIGFNTSRYVFRRNTVLMHNADSTWGVTDTTRNFDRNVLRTTYLQAPLMLQFNTNPRKADKSVHLAVGVIGGYRIGTRQKFKYFVNDDKNKATTKAPFNINPFQLQAHARVGYGKFTVFASYSLLEMFDKSRGPELYPFQAGITLIPW